MDKNELQNSTFVVDQHATIKEVMIAVSDNQRGGVLVVDENFHLIGVAADGDIRRALIRGVDMLSAVSRIVNMNPKFLLRGKDNIEKRSKSIFEQDAAINFIPVVDKNNMLIDVIVRDPKRRKET